MVRPGIGLALLVLATGCTSARPWVPAGTDGMEALTVERQGRLTRLDRLRFGPWATDSARLSWGRGTGGEVSIGSVGRVREGATQPYAFLLLRAGEPVLRVGCVASASRAGVAVRSVEIRTGQELGLDCTFHDGAGERRGGLALAGNGPHTLKGAVEAGGSRYEVEPEPAGSALRRDVRGFWIRHGDTLLAVVDVRGDVVWLAPASALGHDALDFIGAAAAALLVYRPPAES